MAIQADQIGQFLGPALDVTITVVLWAAYLMAILGALYLAITYFTFNIRVMLREYTKGGRTIVRMVRGKKVKSQRLDHPKIRLFGMMGFGGQEISLPPSECIYPYKSIMGNTTLYDFVVKDGIHFPISNSVLGRKYVIMPSKSAKVNVTEVEQWARAKGFDVYKTGENENTLYSIEGSGLEITRDFDSEQATLNDLISAAERYKNKKPIEIAAMYGLMIVMVVGAFVVLFYAFYKVGQIGEAVNRGWEIFQSWGDVAVQQKAGPG